MDLPEASSHSFVIRLWLEETKEEAGRAVWRGHITHVLSGERRSVQTLVAISSFIASYLEAMGVDAEPDTTSPAPKTRRPRRPR
jgi:hypothetical protein